MKLLQITSVGFNVTDQIFCIHLILEEKWENNETVYQLFIDFKKDYGFSEEGSFVQYSHRIPMKLDRLIKMYNNPYAFTHNKDD
jgi:hypothetical protein